jgi:hypothetical protein
VNTKLRYWWSRLVLVVDFIGVMILVLACCGVYLGLFEKFILLAMMFWLAMAIPTSLIASRIGHPKLIAYLVWWPFSIGWAGLLVISLVPQLGANDILAAANFFFWVPGAMYLSVLAIKLGRREEPAGTEAQP